MFNDIKIITQNNVKDKRGLLWTTWKDGFFKKAVNDPWLYAIVYRSEHKPMDPANTDLYRLAEETNLLPESAVKSITKFGMLRQQDLALTWIDKSLMLMDMQ